VPWEIHLRRAPGFKEVVVLKRGGTPVLNYAASADFLGILTYDDSSGFPNVSEKKSKQIQSI
jgi:hypothetical protein